MAMKRYTYDYNGKRYVIDAPEGSTAADLQRIVGGSTSSPSTQPRRDEIAKERTSLEAEKRTLEQRRAKALAEVQQRLGKPKEGFFGNKSVFEGVANQFSAPLSLVQKRLDALAGEEQFIKEKGRAPYRMGAGETLLETARAIPRGAIEGVSQLAGLAGTLGPQGEAFAKSFERGGEKVSEALGLAMPENVKEALQFDPTAQQALGLGGGFGSVIPYAATELISGGTATPALLARAARAGQVAMGTGQGATQARQQLEDFEKETGQKVDPTVRQLVQLGGGAIGLTELINISSMVKVLPRPAREAAVRRLTQLAADAGAGKLNTAAVKAELAELSGLIASQTGGKVLMEGAKEATQEGGSQFAQNVLEQQAYNPEQQLSQDVAENAIMGGAVGAGVRGLADIAEYRANKKLAAQQGEPTPTPTPAAPPGAAPAPVFDEDLQRRTAAYLNVGYPQQYAEEMALADRLREAEEKRVESRKEARKQAAEAAAPEAGAPIEEPRRALRPLTNKQVKEAKDWVRADMMTFPEELVRQPTDAELEQAARELAQDPYVGPLDMLNSIMERNDAQGVAPEAAPVAAPEPMGEAPGTFRTEYEINGETQVVEGPTTPAADQTVEGVATPVAPVAATKKPTLGTYNQASRDFEAGLITRDEFRAKAGLPPVSELPDLTAFEKKVAIKRQQLAEQQAADDAEIAKIEERKGEERPYDIVWKEAKQKYPGVMNPQAIDLMQGFGAVSPDSPEAAPLEVQQMVAKSPEDLATYVEGMQRGIDLHGIPVKLPPVPTDLDPKSREYRQAVGQIELAAKAAAIQGLQQKTGGAPLTVTKGTRIERRGAEGTAHIVELSDGTVVEMFRDTDQFGVGSPVWYVEDPLTTKRMGWEGVDYGLGSTKKEALERVAARVERGRQNTLDAIAPEPEPVAEPEPEAAPEKTALTPYEDVAMSVMWYNNGSRSAVVGAEKPAWVPDDVLLYDDLSGRMPTKDQPAVRLDRFKAKDGTEGTKVSVLVRSIDEAFGDRGNHAATTFWFRNAEPQDVDSAIQTAETIARWVADPKNSKKADGPLNQIADRALKFITEPEPVAEPEPAAEPKPKAAPAPKKRKAAPKAAPEPVAEPEPEVAPEPPAPQVTPEQQANGELVAGEFTDGVVAYQNGDIGLVRAYNQRTGKPTYVPFKGTRYVNTDVSGLKNELTSLSAAEKAELVKAKEDMEAAAAAEHAANPSVTYGDNNLAFSDSVPEALRGVITGWKGMLLDPEAKLFVITAEDAKARKGTFTGPHRAIDYAATQKEEAGRAVKVGPNEFFIVYETNTKPTKVLETVAHELGHIHQWESFNNAPPATQKALREEHFKWVKQQKGKTARALVESLRGRTMGRQVEVSEDLSADQLSTYWTSFSEWYADQTARWAVSNEKPVTVVEKFFARLGKALRNFYQSLRAQRYLPTETFSKYMDESSRNLDLAPEPEAELTYEDVIDEITGAYEGDPTEGIEPQISRQAYNLLKQAAENQKASPEELMDKLREAMDKYAGEDYAAPAKRKVKTAEEIAEADRKIKEKMAGYRAQLGTTQSLEGSGLMDPLAEAYDEHDIKDKSGFIRNAFDNFFRNADYANLRMQLFRLPTRDLVIEAERISNRQEGEGKAPIREAYDIHDKAQGMRSALLNAGARLQEDVDSFIGDKGLRKYADAKQRQSALFGALDYARAAAFNPAAHAGLNDALVNDNVIKIAKDKLAKAKRQTEQTKAKNQIKEREDMIRRGMMYWDNLGKYPGGHETFTKIVDYYATLTRATRNEIDGLVRAMRTHIGDENADAILEIINEADASFDEVPKEGIKGDIFDDIPTRAFPVVYVPWNRFGKYVLQIKPGTPGYPIGYRGQFDTLAEREDEAKRIASKLGIDPNDGAVFNRHSDPNRAAQENATESTVIRNVLKVVRNARLNVSPESVMDETSRDAAAQALKADLEKQLTELLLTALPEESIRKQFIRAKGTPGRSGDHTRVLAYNIQRYANQIPRLKFGYELNNKIETAQQEFKDAPDSQAKEMAEIMIDEIAERLRRGINPPDNNPLAATITSFGHTMILTAPSSAMLNAAVVWQRAAFELSAEYGPKAMVKLAQLEGVMRLMGKISDDPTGNVRKYYAPSVLKLPLIANNPAYRKGFLALRDVYNAFGHGMVQEIILQGRTSSVRPRSVPGYVMDGIRKITDIINAPFGVIERITNEKIGMATFMLEYDKLKAAGKTETEAFNGAVDRARAIVKEIVGAYGEGERPPLFRGPGVFLLQFKTFSLHIAAFIERQYSTLLYEPMAAVGDVMRGRKPRKRSVFTPAEKRQATKILMALYAGNFLWTGTAGLFGFSTIAKLLAPFIFMFMDDDEREEWARENPEYVNNMPGYILEKLIPQTFGGYSDAVAYGPMSALSGINLSARIGYDNLFFKDPVRKSDNAWTDTKSWFMDNFAAGPGRADDFMNGVNSLMDGNVARATKLMVPAAFSAPFKASLALDEGIVDARGREIIRKDEPTTQDIIKLAFGFQPINVSKSYSRLYGSLEQLGAIKLEGRKLLRALNDARADGDYDRVAEIEEQIEDFNAVYPGSAITEETKQRSQSAFESREKRLYRGADFKAEDRERIESDIEEFWREE